MSKATGFYPCPDVDTTGAAVVSQAGGALLTATIGAVGLDRALSQALAPWRPATAVHDPAKVALDLAVTLAVGGDCLADIAVLRAEPGLYGRVASDPTVSRVIDRLAATPDAALRAIAAARATARARAWSLAGIHAPDHGIDAGTPLIIDIDATLLTAHSDKEGAAPTFKRGYGHHPLWAFVDHGPDGTGEPLAVLLRPGNAGSNTAADHITVLREALRQLPGHRSGTRAGRKVLIRADSAGATHELLDWITGQRLSYSVGVHPARHRPRRAQRAPSTGLAAGLQRRRRTTRGRRGRRAHRATRPDPLANRDAGHRAPRTPAPGRATAPDRRRRQPDHRLRHQHPTGGPGRQLADLELRHRRRARAEDRIRIAKDTGLRNLPLHDLAQNKIWCALVTLACEITTWAQMLAFTDHPARRWEPKRLRLRIFSIPARLARSARRTLLHLPKHAPWTALLVTGLTTLHALTAPG